MKYVRYETAVGHFIPRVTLLFFFSSPLSIYTYRWWTNAWFPTASQVIPLVRVKILHIVYTNCHWKMRILWNYGCEKYPGILYQQRHIAFVVYISLLSPSSTYPMTQTIVVQKNFVIWSALSFCPRPSPLFSQIVLHICQLRSRNCEHAQPRQRVV